MAGAKVQPVCSFSFSSLMPAIAAYSLGDGCASAVRAGVGVDAVAPVRGFGFLVSCARAVV
jgi:hypothetical protein